MGEKRRKAAADASPGEIFPKAGQGPLQDEVVGLMEATAATLTEFLPGYTLTMFLAEKEPSGGREFARFNYLSTARREDMLATLKAWIAKNEAEPDYAAEFGKPAAGQA